jgi:putative transposase
VRRLRVVATALWAVCVWTADRRVPFQCFEQPVYLITFVTHKRQRWLAAPAVHEAFLAFADRAYDGFGIAVGRYVIMPDHVHLLVCGGRGFEPGPWIGSLKQFLARSAQRRLSDGQIWQEGSFDHLLRSDESLAEKWEYVRNNPAIAGLERAAENWPFQGEIMAIDRA